MSTKQSVAEQYLHLKENHKEELVFFQIGEFYEVLFDDAIKAAQLLNINLTKRGKYREQDIPLCGVPVHAIELYVSKLLKQKCRVAIYEQSDDGGNRKLQRVFTPGTILTDELLAGGKNNFLMCIVEENKKLEICIGDISTGELYIKYTSLDDLDSLLLQWNPVEILVSEKILHSNKVQETIGTWMPQVTILQDDFFLTSDSIYKDFFTEEVFESVKSVSLKGLLHYIQHTKAFNIKQLQLPKLLQNSEYMSISKNSRINLELCQTTTGDKDGSLFLALNKTSTFSGSRWLHKQLNAPLTNLVEINKRLDYVEFFLANYALSFNIAGVLSDMPDIERASHRLNSGLEKKQDFINILKGLQTLCKLNELTKTSDKCELLNEFNDVMDELQELKEAFEQNITDELGAFINKKANSVLQKLSQEEDNLNKRIYLLEEEYKLEVDLKTLKIKHQNTLGHFIEIASKDSGKMSYNFKLLQNLTNSKRYITGTLEEINLKSTQIALQTQEAERQILYTLLNLLKSKKLVMHKCYELLSKIDVFVAFAKVAKLYDFIRPTFVEETCLDIKNGYHIAIASNDMKFKPNDCKLNTDALTVFLTGPNMSGKSTYMRQNAQLIVLAQIGCFVPAKSAVMNITDAIYTRIGAYDDITQGKSTFMCEMSELSQILKFATNKSFILLDEIGRGTTPKEGAAIAQAVLEHIMFKIKARTIFATHFADIGQKMGQKMYNSKNLLCKTMSFEIEGDNRIKFLYKMIDGISTYSYGIAVSEQAGLPDDIITNAKKILTEG